LASPDGRISKGRVEFDISTRKMVDVQKIFHMMEPRTLGAAFKFYCNKSLDNAHSAEVDADATWEILDAQVIKYPQLGTSVDSIVQFLGDEPLVDFARRFIFENGVEVFNFGKHKGRPVADVLKQEPQYYDWMMKGDFPMHTKQKLTEIFNRTLLKKPDPTERSSKFNMLINLFQHKFTLLEKLVVIPTYNEKDNIENILRYVFNMNKDFHVPRG
jgi:uncharacterized protein (DUF3820 family)